VARPRLLDLYGGGGGAGIGYVRAGWDVTSIDKRTMSLPDDPHFRHVKGDVLPLLKDMDFLRTFDAIHASPPCQTETRLVSLRNARGFGTGHKNLIPQTRQGLGASGVPYVIENVPGSSVYPDLVLCGSSFGLGVRRHRWFESNVVLTGLDCDHARQGATVGVYGSLGDTFPGGSSTASTLSEASVAMGIDWMSWYALKEAIPPAYTEHIGRQLLAVLGD
jgi:DNA (cytosine-5)-methyltransferase 1